MINVTHKLAFYGVLAPRPCRTEKREARAKQEKEVVLTKLSVH